MGRQARRKQHRQQAARGGEPAQQAGSTAWYGLNPSPYFAVQNNGSRQDLQTFGEDTGKQVDKWSRTEVMVIARTLFANYGIARAIRTLNTIIGHLSPQAQSGDEDWDTLAEERFADVTEAPLLFDAAGRHVFKEWQVKARERQMVDCDLFSVLTVGEHGNAMLAAREAHLVKSPKDGSEGWFDGIQTDANNRTLAYRFTNPKDPSFARILKAGAVFHHVDCDTFGGTRGMSIFTHAANHFRDIIETRAFMKLAIKQAAMIGLTRAQDAQHGADISSMGLGAPTYTSPFVPPGGALPTTAAEAKDLPKMKFEDFMKAGIFSQVPLKVLHDDRPHPNQIEFARDLLREVAIGVGVPPQILFYMDDPGGAWSRILLEILAKYILDQHMRQTRPFCQRTWNYVISREMEAGRLRECKGKWWKVRWTPPRSITADMGRMGRLVIELRKMLMTTYRAYYEELGYDYESELRQCGKELKLIKEIEVENGLEPGELSAALRPQGFMMEQPGNGDGNAGGGGGGEGQKAETEERFRSIEENVERLMERYPAAA